MKSRFLLLAAIVLVAGTVLPATDRASASSPGSDGVGRSLTEMTDRASASSPGGPSQAQPQPGDPQAGPGLLTLASQPASVALDGDFVLRVRISGAPPGAVLRVDVHDRVTTRIGFARSLDAQGLRRRIRQVGPAALSSLSTTGDEFEVRVPLGPGTDELRLAGSGVYPVVVSVLDGDDTALARMITHLVAIDASAVDTTAPPLDVALVLPVGSPEPSLQPDGTIAVPSRARDAVAALAAVLSTHAAVPLTVLAAPETIESLVASTAVADAGVVPSLAGALAGRQLPAGPYVQVEPESWLDAGLADELGQQIERGTAVVTEQLGRPDGRTWLADPSTGEDTLSWLRARGVDQLVMPESSLTPLDEDLFPVTLTQTFLVGGVPGLRAVMADAGLVAHAGSTGDPLLDAHHALADLVVLYLDQPGALRGVVFGARGWSPSAPFVDAVLSGLASIPVVEPVTLDRLFADVPAAGSRGQTDGDAPPLVRTIDPEPTARLGRFPDVLRDAGADVSTFESAVGPTNPLPGSLRARLLAAGAAVLSGTERARYTATVRDQVRGELGKIEIPERRTITLTARSGRVPLTVRNTAGYPVDVLIRLRSEKLAFPDEPDLELPLTLDQETNRVELRVRARASGSTPLIITLWSPDGRFELGETRYTVRSTAFSGVGLVLSVGAVSFLVAWWARSARRTLRARRADARNRHPGGQTPLGDPL